MFALTALLQESVPTLPQLQGELEALFRNEVVPSMSHERLPFSGRPQLTFRWPTWSFTVQIPEGQDAKDLADAAQTAAGMPLGASNPRALIRIVFASDPSQDFTNHVIWVTEHLIETYRAVIYDETQQSLWV